MTKYKFKEFKRIRGEKYIKLKDGHIYISPAVIRSWGNPKEIKIKYDKAAGAILLDPLGPLDGNEGALKLWSNRQLSVRTLDMPEGRYWMEKDSTAIFILKEGK